MDEVTLRVQERLQEVERKTKEEYERYKSQIEQKQQETVSRLQERYNSLMAKAEEKQRRLNNEIQRLQQRYESNKSQLNGGFNGLLDFLKGDHLQKTNESNKKSPGNINSFLKSLFDGDLEDYLGKYGKH